MSVSVSFPPKTLFLLLLFPKERALGAMVNSAAAAGFDPKTFIFRSPRGELTIPPDLTIPSFLFQTTSARAYHHRVAIADASSRLSLTFSQLRLRIGSAARALSYAGVSQGDVVLLLSPNSIHFPVLFFAIVSLGAVATTANPVYTPREIERQARDSRAKLIVAHPDLLPKLSSGLNLPILVIDSDSSPGKSSPSHGPAVSYLSDAERLSAGHLPPPARIRQADTAVLLYSSGTTGPSKAVPLSHLNLIASAIQTNSDAARFSEMDLSFFVPIPFFHVYGLSVILFAQLQRGNTIVTTPRFDLVDMLKAIEEYHVTSLPLVPPIMLALAKHDVALKYDLSSVIEITSGAAPLGKETVEEVSKRFKIPDVRQVRIRFRSPLFLYTKSVHTILSLPSRLDHVCEVMMFLSSFSSNDMKIRVME